MKIYSQILLLVFVTAACGGEIGSPTVDGHVVATEASSTHEPAVVSNVVVRVYNIAQINDFPQNTYNTVIFNSVATDPHGLWNTTTGKMSIPDESYFGYYFIWWDMHLTDMSLSNWYRVRAYPYDATTYTRRRPQATATGVGDNYYAVVKVDSTNDLIFVQYYSENRATTDLDSYSCLRIRRLSGL